MLSALFVGWLWGGLREPATIHDESAYLLQAELSASGRLAADAPPLPECFEQSHLLVTPRLAPKYPTGHAWLLLRWWRTGGVGVLRSVWRRNE